MHRILPIFIGLTALAFGVSQPVLASAEEPETKPLTRVLRYFKTIQRQLGAKWNSRESCFAAPGDPLDGVVFSGNPENQEHLQNLLRECGIQFGPTTKTGNAKYQFSPIFTLPTGYKALLFQVEIRGKKYLRTAYLSQSQNVFRLLPATVDLEGGKQWFDKGIGEESLNLPLPIQKILGADLAAIGLANYPKSTPPNSRCNAAKYEEIFETSVWSDPVDRKKRYTQRKPFNQAFKSPLRVAEECSNEHFAGEDEFLEHIQSIHQADYDMPDCRKGLDGFSSYSGLSDQVDGRIIPSRDRKVHYLLYRDSAGGKWFGGAEIPESSINIYGVRSKPVFLGCLGSPLWEYPQQIPYGFRAKELHLKDPSYASNRRVLKAIFQRIAPRCGKLFESLPTPSGSD